MKIIVIFVPYDTFLANRNGKLKLHYEGDNSFI